MQFSCVTIRKSNRFNFGFFMLSLKSFHVFFIALAIIITAGFGMWGVLNTYRLSGAVSLR